MSSFSNSSDPNAGLTIVNRKPYRPATTREPVSAYSLLKRNSSTSAQLSTAELERLDQLRETQFFDFLQKNGCVTADGNTRGIIQTVWGDEVVSYFYTGLVTKGDTTHDAGDAPQPLLEGFMDGLRRKTETIQQGLSQIFVPYYAKKVKQRMIWVYEYTDPEGQTTISRSGWATVVLTHGKESCSPFCPTPGSVGQTTMMPEDDKLCAERDLSRAARLRCMERDVEKEQREGGT